MSNRTAIPRAAAPLIFLGTLLFSAACLGPTVPPTPTPSPIPSPIPSPTPEPKILTVCMPKEPDSLYLYGTASLAARHVWQAIYDGPVDGRNYAFQPVILTGLPSLTDGTAAIETVAVQAGDHVVAANGEVVPLASGVMVEDAGGQRVPFDGTPILMQRMVVTFTLHPNLAWSDGAPLTADDSMYSFELAADPATPADLAASGGWPASTANKHGVERTAAYRALDARTVVWTGLPGFLDRAYLLNFWPPLPRHAWGGLSAADLLTADVATRQPIGWGPFLLREWVPDDRITVVRNPLYFRASEGLPRLDQVTFRFIPDPSALVGELVAGRCDVVTHEGAETGRAALSAQPEIQEYAIHDARWELLAFGISPANDYERPDFFEDVRVRQAIALCIDRQAVANQVLGPAGRVLNGPLPPEHPLYAGTALTTWGYDPAAGQVLLASAGWYDEDGDGLREAHAIPGIADGTPFQVTYRTTGDPLRVQAAQLIQTYLAACGLQTSVELLPSETLFAPGPEGVLFGRRFDLAQFSWRAQPDPLCDLFLSSHVPDVGRWHLPNVAGFLDDDYDTACQSALASGPGSDAYAAGNAEAQRLFSERLPVLPLFQRLKITLARRAVIGLAPDPTQDSELWNVEQLDLRP